MAFNTRRTEHPLEVDRPPGAARTPVPQYSLTRVMVVWAAAALPMGALAWVVAPWLADVIGGTGALARALILCLTVGLVWQFVLVVVLVRREQGTLQWPVVKDALWLHAPVSVPWGIPGALLDTVLLAYLSRRFRSALIGIAVHSAQSVFFLVVILAVVLG